MGGGAGPKKIEKVYAAPAGMRIEQIHDGLWIIEGAIVDFFGFAYPTRSVIARLESGDLWVWSPVELTQDLRDALSRLGTVRHLVSPNKLHHLYLAAWGVTYPSAQLWGPQSTIQRRRGLRFRSPLTDVSPAEWRTEIDQAWFKGSFAMDEIVFFHRPSGTVIIADLIQAFDEAFLHQHWAGWRASVAAMGGITSKRPGTPLDWRLSFLDESAARPAKAKVLSWPIERVVIAHGRCQSANGRDFVDRALSWIGP